MKGLAVEWKDRGMSFNHFALTHIQNLHTHPALIDRISEHVTIFGVSHRNFLFLHKCVDIHNLVTQLFGPLEIQFLSGFLHFTLQLFLDFFMPTTQKRMDLLRNFIVLSLRNPLHTGRQTLAHMIIQTHLFRHYVALTQWIHTIKQFLGLLSRIAVRIRTEVLRFIL
ncbi:hypothetical protein D3C77_391170 [compost metagenome]